MEKYKECLEQIEYFYKNINYSEEHKSKVKLDRM